LCLSRAITPTDSISFNPESHLSRFRPVMLRLLLRCYRLYGFFFPERRMICAIGVVAADISLVALNLHFLSDVVAGSFVGVSTGLFTVALWRASELGMQVVKLASVQSDAWYCRARLLGIAEQRRIAIAAAPYLNATQQALVRGFR
jgi:hypothetical protein